MRIIRNRKGRFTSRLDSLTRYSHVYVDVFSIAASLKEPEELFRGLAESGIDAVLVIVLGMKRISLWRGVT